MNEKRRADLPTSGRTRPGAGGGRRDPAEPAPRGARAKKWAYGELSVTDIVAAASGIVQRDGIEALSMRRVADELGLSTMSMYYYVESKRALLILVVEEALQRVTVPSAESGPWDDRLRQLLRSTRIELGRYPGLIKAMVDLRLATPRSQQLSDAARDLLLDGGFGDDPVALLHTTTVFINHLFGTLSWNLGPWAKQEPEHGPDASRAGLSEELNEQLFEYGLNLLLDGLRDRLDSGVRAARPRRAATG